MPSLKIYGEHVNFESSSTPQENDREVKVDQPSIVVGGSEQVMSLKSKFQKHLEQKHSGGESLK